MLKYVGKGQFVVGIPARDLDITDVARLGGVESVMRNAPGLYVLPPAKPKPKRSGRAPDAAPPTEEKSL